MKKLLILTFAVLLSSTAIAQTCTVVGVADGDTLTCLTRAKQQIKVRLNQIDAPEKRQPYGTAAGKKLSDLVFGKTVDLRSSGTDKYNRTLAEVYLGNTNINKEMVKAGYAWAYRQYMTDSQYLTLENQARAARLGLWADPNPIYPSDYRHGSKATANTSTPSYPATPRQQPSYTYTRQPTTSNSSSGFTCGSKRVCAEMTSCAEARYYLTQCGLSRLDGDNDGVPCEKLCR